MLIGGAERAGQGWRMLMSASPTGRAISLPAIGTAGVKGLRVTSAYARIRRQFAMPVGLMEGVAEPLGAHGRDRLQLEAARARDGGHGGEGRKPAVMSAPDQIPGAPSDARTA